MIFILYNLFLLGSLWHIVLIVVLVNCIICKNGQSALTFLISYSENAENNNILLWKGDTENGILVYFRNGNNVDTNEVEDSLCVEKDYYTLVLQSM